MHLACCGRFRGWPVFSFLRCLSLSLCFLKEREERRDAVQKQRRGQRRARRGRLVIGNQALSGMLAAIYGFGCVLLRYPKALKPLAML